MKGEAFSVGPTPTPIMGAAPNSRDAAGFGSASYPTAGLIRIPAGSPTVYMGGSTVSTTSGVPFVAGENLQADLVNEILYARTATTTATVYVLRRGD